MYMAFYIGQGLLLYIRASDVVCNWTRAMQEVPVWSAYGLIIIELINLMHVYLVSVMLAGLDVPLLSYGFRKEMIFLTSC